LDGVTIMVMTQVFAASASQSRCFSRFSREQIHFLENRL
jgi:hypothetical protein